MWVKSSCDGDKTNIKLESNREEAYEFLQNVELD